MQTRLPISFKKYLVAINLVNQSPLESTLSSLRMFMVLVSFIEEIHLLEGRSRGVEYLGHDVELPASSRLS